MPSKALSGVLLFLGVIALTTVASTHNLAEVTEVFEGEVIPPELLEVTKDLDSTAGTKSVREHMHHKQHQLLQDYLHARTTRKCVDSLAMLPRLDQEIVEFREQSQIEEERKLRELRDTTAAFISANCSTP